MKKLLAALCAVSALVGFGETLRTAVNADPTSTYVPTTAINGDLEVEPFMEFVQGGVHYTRENARFDRGSGAITAIYPNGVDGGWNTSENTRYGSSFFEWGGPNGWGSRDGHGHFMEMNANNPAVFWQDLTTYGGDVILWSVRHGARYDFGYFDQCIRVEIGAPNGVASGLWANVNSNIKTDTKVIYSHNGVQNPEGDVTYGYAGELEGLFLHNCPGEWRTVTGVYLIPEGQDVTRFAFLSILPSDSGAGNLLDDLTFSTLIGNLKAVANDDGSVTFTGYWGDADASKSLRIEFGGQIYDLDMSGVLNKNFTVTIPYSLIGGATVIDVYHEDYPQAKRSVIIQHPNQFLLVAEGTTFKAWCTNENHIAFSGCPHAGEDNAVVIQFAAEDKAFTGLPYDGVALTGEISEWGNAGLDLPTFTYAVRGSTDFSATAPTAVGYYTVKATVRDDVFATDNFRITNAGAGHFHCICCDKVDTHDHSELEWQAWESTTTLPTSAGNWYLTDNVVLSAAYEPVDGVNICLNGHVIRQSNASARVIKVNSGRNFQVTDCNPSVEHKFSVDANGVWTLDESAGTKTAFGGCITGGSVEGANVENASGAGVYVAGNFNMYGGNIVGNSAAKYGNTERFGGGVVAWNGTFTMYDGAIMGNYTCYGGAVAIRYDGAFIAYGGKLNENHAWAQGGAICANGRFDVSNVEICDNKVDYDGGAIHTYSDRWDPHSSYIRNSRICNNTAGSAAGAIHLYFHTLTLDNVVLTDNVSTTSYGGVWVYNDGTGRTGLVIGGSTVIEDNLAAGKDSNVVLDQNAIIVVSTDSPLTDTARIGVTTVKTPTSGNPVPVTSNRGEDYLLFSSDDPRYLVVNEDGVVKLAVPDAWQVGDDVWAYTDSVGTLYVYGTGSTWDYDTKNPPWYKGVLNIKKAVIADGVTEIGNRFFKKCYNMKSIVCGSSVVRFRERAFYLCTSLVDIGVSNPGFEISCLQDSIIYQMAIDSATGKFFMVPSVEISGFTPTLYGKRELTDAEWTRLGALANRNLNELKAVGTYHFFQTRLE